MSSVSYSYSKITAFFLAVFLLALISGGIFAIVKFTHLANLLNWMLLIGFVDILLGLLFYISVKTLIPAIQNKSVLEFNCDGIVANFENRELRWNDIHNIELKSGGTPSLYIEFDPSTQYENLKISLGIVKGRNTKIYHTAVKFWERYK